MATPDEGLPAPPEIRLEDALFVRCPDCNTLHLLTPNAEEARRTQEAGIPEPAVYNEEVDVGGGMRVHFVQCTTCRHHFVGRLVLANRDKFEHYERMKKYRPSMERPKPRMRWQGCSFQVWMVEVMQQPSWMVRQKAERECARRGLFLPWEAVARQLAASG